MRVRLTKQTLTVVWIFSVIFLVSGCPKNENKALLVSQNDMVKLCQQAENYSVQGDLEPAQRYINRVLEIKSDDPWALRIIAQINRQRFEQTKEKKYLELAQSEIEKALCSLVNDVPCHREAATIYYLQKNKTKALEEIDRVLKINPQDEASLDLREKIELLL